MPPVLGYRGCTLELPDGSGWSVFGGVVTHGARGADERRVDRGRVIERLLIESAPAGTIPAGVLTSIGLP